MTEIDINSEIIDRVSTRLLERLGLDRQAAGAPAGLGAPRVDRRLGTGAPSGPVAPGEVEWLMLRSPVLAYARARGLAFEPFIMTVSTTFSAAGTATNPDNQQAQYSARDVMFHAVDVDIQDPNSFAGQLWKAERDYYFAMTSGLQCTVKIDGENRWANSYFPVRALEKFIAPSDPWILRSKQAVKMDFTTTTALPAAGAIVTVTFLGVTPRSDAVIRLSDLDAFNQLAKLGYDTTDAMKNFGLT